MFQNLSYVAMRTVYVVLQHYFLICCDRLNLHSRSGSRPGGTDPVGPAMAGPTFGLGRIFLKIQNKIVNLRNRIKSVYKKMVTSSNRKTATNCDSGI